MHSINRRHFLQQSFLTAAIVGGGTASLPAAGFADSKTPAAAAQPVWLGGPIFVRSDDPDELAKAHRQLGYSAAYCPNVPLTDSARIRALSEAFRKQKVVIAEVGRWVNLLDADPEKRAANMKYVTEGLALADEIGALCCVDIAGSFSTKEWFGPHPDNLSPRFMEAAVENARKIIDAVKPKRARFCYEMMGWALPDSADSCLNMLKAVDRQAFAVHLDPCNLINSPERFYRNTDLINECFDKLGPWIVSCHAKDLEWKVEMNIHFLEVRPGAGALDYTTFLRRLASLPNHPPMMLEHLPNAEEYKKGADYIFEHGREIGIQFA
jgi:sugar phosphate isomerase/epimerase